MALRLGTDLTLPVDAVTQVLAFLGRRGSGKTYAATALAELMDRAGAQFVFLDPVGTAYGLRLAADGKGKGLDIPIFGGLHGDVPIEATGGALLADLIVDRVLSCVLDVSQFESDADKARFARDFAARFFYRKKGKPSAVHIFVEEAQEFIPQNPQHDEAMMLHAWQRLVRLGRNYGIGVSILSQRPQDVNKKALNQAECLFAFQLTGPQERKTVAGWIAEKGLDVDLVETLPGLKVGHAHVWSPVWLEINREVVIADKRTFAAGSTPKVGARPIEPKPLEPLELEAVRKAMAATIERAKENDPRELRREIARLKAEARRLDIGKMKPEAPRRTKIERVRLPLLSAVELSRLQRGAIKWVAVLEWWEGKGREEIQALVHRLEGRIIAASDLMQRAAASPRGPGSPPGPRTPLPDVTSRRSALPEPTHAPGASARGAVSTNGHRPVLKRGAREMLAALIRRHPQAMTRSQLAMLVGIRSGGSTLTAYLSNLRTAGMITEEGESVAPTISAFSYFGDVEPSSIKGTDAIIALWERRLKAGARRMLRHLRDKYPHFATREELARVLGIEAGGSTLTAYLSNLRTAGLIEDERGEVRLNANLFLEG